MINTKAEEAQPEKKEKDLTGTLQKSTHTENIYLVMEDMKDKSRLVRAVLLHVGSVDPNEYGHDIGEDLLVSKSLLEPFYGKVSLTQY